MQNPIRSLKILSILQFAVTIVLAVPIFLWGGLSLGASFLAGSAVMLGNLLLLAWTWWRVLSKKSIAWTVLVIVIKYAVLLGTLVYLGRAPWFHALGAGLGISSFLLAAVGFAIFSQEKETE